jgi:serine protease AprX
MRSFTLFLFWFLGGGLVVNSFAQSNPRYLILFKDKANSPYSISNPKAFLSDRSISRRVNQKIVVTENDLPVNPSYISAIKQTGALAIFPSRWFNGLVVEASDGQLELIKKLSCFKAIELNLPIANIGSKSPGVERSISINQKFEALEEVNYGRMRDQLALLGVDQLHQKGFQGENMLIAVFDNGFTKANELDYFKPLFDDKRVIDSFNFLSRQTNVYASGDHGRNVLSLIASYKPGTLVGAAFKASFALYVTESDAIESPYEEVTWLMAAERADSLGVDVINSSLGYSQFGGVFDTPTYNYTYSMMDGKTTIISRAARIAGRKGMLVVNAAGNEGNNKNWPYLLAPADVDSVLTVAASDYFRNYASLSSVGPNAARQLKPDVAAVGQGAIVGNASGGVSSGSGTSYASPQIAGLSAILWQAHRSLSAQQIISVLKKSGSQASKPDSLLGYGVPDVLRAEAIIQVDYPILGTEGDELNEIILSPNPVDEDIQLAIPESLRGRTAAIQVISLNGRTIAQRQITFTAKPVLSTGDLSPGLYILRINVGSRQRALKFLKL